MNPGYICSSAGQSLYSLSLLPGAGTYIFQAFPAYEDVTFQLGGDGDIGPLDFLFMEVQSSVWDFVTNYPSPTATKGGAKGGSKFLRRRKPPPGNPSPNESSPSENESSVLDSSRSNSSFDVVTDSSEVVELGEVSGSDHSVVEPELPLLQEPSYRTALLGWYNSTTMG
jgi:hypothetical protein